MAEMTDTSNHRIRVTPRDAAAILAFIVMLAGYVWSAGSTAQRFEEVEKIVPRVEAQQRASYDLDWRVKLLERQLGTIDSRTEQTNKAVLEIREALIRMGVRIEGLTPKTIQ